ncbi:LysE family translocator [Vibrio sp. Of7-15]|uniref:LysE family translocator n=1 Tax=Vibrio sp. Of7-15 TaxID=2724879 RepID=UPI001EF311B2|nr:LysE family translocator [Vibrio sp. Of7-15]MCG7500150.1 LysE family translocator [Vibrio sp. Of7-15]
MSDLNFWLLFLTAAVALNAAPGPDLLYIMTKTITGGKKVGFASALGVCTGALFHVFCVSVGLSALLASSEVAFDVVKYIGAAYLLYLAFQSFRSSGFDLIPSETASSQESAFEAFKQGIMIDILNPKVAIFFLAYLPQFVRDIPVPASIQLLYLGLLVILVAIVVEGIYVLLTDSIAHKVRTNRLVSLWMDRFVGVVFAGLGLKLAFSAI